MSGRRRRNGQEKEEREGGRRRRGKGKEKKDVRERNWGGGENTELVELVDRGNYMTLRDRG